MKYVLIYLLIGVFVSTNTLFFLMHTRGKNDDKTPMPFGEFVLSILLWPLFLFVLISVLLRR